MGGTVGAKIGKDVCTAELHVRGADAAMLEDEEILPEAATQQQLKKTNKDKSKKYEKKILPEKPHEELITKVKLKKVKTTEDSESPLDKLKRLENAPPIEIDDDDSFEDEYVTELPSYDLPTKRQKSDLLTYESHERETKIKEREQDQEQPADWDRLKKKKDEIDDAKIPIILGKGKKAEIAPEKDLRLKKKQKDISPTQDESVTLKPFDTPTGANQKSMKKPDVDKSGSSKDHDMKPRDKMPFDTSSPKKGKGKKDMDEVTTDQDSTLYLTKSDSDKLPKDSVFEHTKSDTNKEKSKHAKTVPEKPREEISPQVKLRKVKTDEDTETPLEKLKRLENALPNEIDDDESFDNEYVKELPSYDLPTKGQKSDLLKYKPQDREPISKEGEEIQEQPADWDRLKKKKDEIDEPKKPIILGKGK